jgi:pimeloyl-ACP methyl ester carboxylesterase
VPYPLYEFGGSGSLIHLAVANGFPPGSYQPLMAALTPDYHAVSLPPRALWPDQATLEKPSTWATLADDLLAGLQAHDLHAVIALGHSFGALATILAANQKPEQFAALCLLDPTILPTQALELIAQVRAKGMIDQMPLALGARRRRAAFASEQEAFDYWRQRKLFQDWSDDSLWAYTRSMLRASRNGTGMALTWPPEWEAHYYETIDVDPWPVVSDLAALDLPVLVVRGETTDTFTAEPAARARDMLPKASFRTVPGHGHLFPLAAPEFTAQLIRDWLRKRGL